METKSKLKDDSLLVWLVIFLVIAIISSIVILTFEYNIRELGVYERTMQSRPYLKLEKQLEKVLERLDQLERKMDRMFPEYEVGEE